MPKALHIQRLGDFWPGAANGSVYRSINKILTECMPGWDLEDRQTGLETDDAKNMLLVKASSKDQHQDTEEIIFCTSKWGPAMEPRKEKQNAVHDMLLSRELRKETVILFEADMELSKEVIKLMPPLFSK